MTPTPTNDDDDDNDSPIATLGSYHQILRLLFLSLQLLPLLLLLLLLLWPRFFARIYDVSSRCVSATVHCVSFVAFFIDVGVVVGVPVEQNLGIATLL
jgi:hypothetical protein